MTATAINPAIKAEVVSILLSLIDHAATLSLFAWISTVEPPRA